MMPLQLRAVLSLSLLMGLCLSVDATQPVVVPKGVILVKGAVPATSDSAIAMPEDGAVVDGHYRNAYFGFVYPIPDGWSEEPAGPPPSDSGNYVLTQFALVDRATQRVRANVLVTAQDLFFSPMPVANAAELVAALRRGLDPDYELERGSDAVKIGGRTFARFAYKSTLAGLHWRTLSTDVRCHAVTFTFTGIDSVALDDAERALSKITMLPGADDPPTCIKDYAKDDRIVEKTDPHLTVRRYNTIPVRVIVNREGHVKHIHVLSAFPDQSETIIAALRTWRFAPYVRDGKAMEVETGVVFGLPRTIMRR